MTVGASDRPPSAGDPLLVGAAIGLSLFGAMIVYSATRGTEGDVSFGLRQLLFVGVGTAAMVAMARFDYRRLRPAAPALAVVTVAALAAVLSPLGTEVRGTQGWFQLGGLSLQPAELAKVAVAVVVATLLTSTRPIEHRGRFVAGRFVAVCATVAVVAGLVMAGGETGSVLVYLATGLGILVAGGIPVRVVGLLVVTAVVALGLLITSDVLEPYQRQRLEAFVDIDADPLGAGYNQRQSVTAIGSGGLGGKGLFQGPQTQLRYLPEQQTDFIFAVVSEELGFIGAVAVLLTEGCILYRILAVARRAADPFGGLLCAGIFAGLAVQIVQNVAMNLRLAPVTGIPLPFVSYGGSSLLATFLAIGLVQSVAARRPARRAAPSLARRRSDVFALTSPVSGLTPHRAR